MMTGNDWVKNRTKNNRTDKLKHKAGPSAFSRSGLSQLDIWFNSLSFDPSRLGDQIFSRGKEVEGS